MPTLALSKIAALLEPYTTELDDAFLSHLSTYLDLLMKWNLRTNLTAIREPEEIVRRHFGESLFAAQHLGNPVTLLDYGSGAGFPGIPIALSRPEIHVTLAESQNRKASFLREVIRSLNLATAVWADRAETMPSASRFDCVTLRAVDKMTSSLQAAALLSSRSIFILTTNSSSGAISPATGFVKVSSLPVPRSTDGVLLHFQIEDM